MLCKLQLTLLVVCKADKHIESENCYFARRQQLSIISSAEWYTVIGSIKL